MNFFTIRSKINYQLVYSEVILFTSNTYAYIQMAKIIKPSLPNDYKKNNIFKVKQC